MTEGNSKAMAPLTLEELKEPLTSAERQEMDNPHFIYRLNMFIEAVNNIPNLSKFHRYCLTEQQRDHVKQRTFVNQAIAKNPDIANMTIDPVVIIGLPRSGTTMLHRLLSCDPRFVAPMAFELLQPCPPGRPENWRGTERYKKAQEYMSHLFPGGVETISHMHEINMDLPDECTLALQAAMMESSWMYHSAFKKLKESVLIDEEKKSVEAYKYYKNALKCIFYNGLENGEVPLLKAPTHTLYIDTCKKIFPGAKFIFPSRNAKEMVGSGCSLFSKAVKAMPFEADEKSAREYCFEFFKLGSSRVVNAMKTMPKETLYSVSYSEMVKDPLAAVKEIYANFGWEVTPQMMENMQRHLQENKQHKLGKHNYDLEEMGITEDFLKQLLPEYLEYFGAKENLL